MDVMSPRRSPRVLHKWLTGRGAMHIKYFM